MRLRLSFLQILVLALLCGACTAGAGVGWFGGLAAAFAAGALLLAACSQPDNNKNNGDDPDVGPCLSIAIDMDQDAGMDAEGDADQPDVGPCLSIAPDFGDDTGPSDAGDDAATDAATDGGPEMGMAPTRDRDEILDRMRDRLPADVAERLDSDDDLA